MNATPPHERARGSGQLPPGEMKTPQITAKSAAPQANFAPHHRTEARAIEMAGMLIHDICEHGLRADVAISPTEMPNPALADLLAEILATKSAGAGWENVLVELLTRHPGERGDRLRADLMEACQAPYPPERPACIAAREFVVSHHKVKRRWELTRHLADLGQRGASIGETLAELLALEAGGKSQALLDRVYEMRFDPAKPHPPDEVCLNIGDFPIASRGNLTGVQGKSKVGKSAIVSAIIGAVIRGNYQAAGDTLSINWEGEASGAIVHLDTEQSPADWHALVMRGITRSGIADPSDRLVFLPLVPFARSDRLLILEQTLEREQNRQGAIDAVVIDGLADLCKSPNDEEESLELISKVMALAQRYRTPVICILHENPSSQDAKTRGHLGSELNRKAFANLRIDKDTETSVSTIYGTEMRKREIPRNQGFCFAWDAAAGMHAFKGRAAGLKAAQKNAEAQSKARAIWEPIFDLAAEKAEQREKSIFPALTPTEAAEIERELSRKEKTTLPDTMKKRMQKAEALGVLRKSDLLRWTITRAGTAGTEREN